MGARNIKSHFLKFAHNRFNVMFHNSSALYHHHRHIREFLGEVTQTNQLMEAARGDLQDDILMACVRGVALVHVLITAPFHVLVMSSDTSHILGLNPYLKKLRTALEELSSNPWCLLRENYSVWEDKPPHKNEVYLSVLPTSDNEDHLDLTMEVVSLVATHCLVTYSRQVSSQLPGGEHTTSSDDLRAESNSVPTSNSIGESHFAYLKYLRHIKPNASVENVEGSVMWAYNKTLPWLQTLAQPDRQKILSTARSRCRDFKDLWAERQRAIHIKRLENLKIKEHKQEERVAKQATGRQKTLDEVDNAGGQCRTEDEVNDLVEKHTNSKELLRALKSQLPYYKTIVCPPGVPKTLFQFSRLGKAFSCEQLANNLKCIITQYHEYLSATLSASSQPTIADPEVRKTKLKGNKDVLCNYHTMTDDVSSATCRKGVKREGEFPDPVGKRIRHRWKVGNTRKWYNGTVLGICSAEDLPTEKDDDDDNMATNSIYDLYEVSYDGEEETFRRRIEKDWFRKDLDFVDDGS